MRSVHIDDWLIDTLSSGHAEHLAMIVNDTSLNKLPEATPACARIRGESGHGGPGIVKSAPFYPVTHPQQRVGIHQSPVTKHPQEIVMLENQPFKCG